jgi:hypothetical protein
MEGEFRVAVECGGWCVGDIEDGVLEGCVISVEVKIVTVLVG